MLRLNLSRYRALPRQIERKPVLIGLQDDSQPLEPFDDRYPQRADPRVHPVGAQRVAHDIAVGRPVLAAEFLLTLAEMRVLPQMKDALTNLSNRTQSRPVQLLVSTLIQTLQYGTPLGQSLRTLSAEMHVHRFLQYEANAAKLPVMLTLPMVVFILPTMFLVVCGPAAIQVIEAMRSMQ